MNKKTCWLALVMAGLIISGNAGLPKVYAQTAQEPPKEGWRQEQERKYQERWDYLEKENRKTTGERLLEADQKRRDAEKRQRKAEQQMRELEEDDD